MPQLTQLSSQDATLAVLPGSDEDQRLVIVMVQQPGCSGELQLRQESRSSDVGWFEQSRINITPDQVAGLRTMLSGCCGKSSRSTCRTEAQDILPFPGCASRAS